MTVLITGAAGHVGGVLARALLARGQRAEARAHCESGPLRQQSMHGTRPAQRRMPQAPPGAQLAAVEPPVVARPGFTLAANSEIFRRTRWLPQVGQATSLTASALRTSSSNERSQSPQLNS